MTKEDHAPESYAWAGPILFITVLVLLIVFFWRFLG